jgi:Tfp pilus assembly protein PilX
MASKTRQSDHGSALILTLLITALLATIVVSFLSTSRVEQIAAKNFSRQNAASGLAEMATQQAMAQIQQGFTVNGTGTTVITTQPGAIRQYIFNNGNCSAAPPVNLYSSNGTVQADLNNLQNPSNTTQVRGNVSANQTFTITGNASNRLLVKMEDVTSNGTLVGRIAYYVDDELTKININAATDNRTTLNVSTPRSMSLSAFTTANLTTFRSIVDGTISNDPSSINSWGYFFRKEQADKVTGFNGNQMSNISTAPLSDFHLKYTPWGSRRLHINDQVEVPLNSTGVDIVFNTLNSTFLRDIYGQTFAHKYGQSWSWTGNKSQTSNNTVNGLKQTIANMLQMRTKGSSNAEWLVDGYNYYGAVISENSTSGGLPSGYYAHTPAMNINEFAVQADYVVSANGTITLNIRPFIEFTSLFVDPYGSHTPTGGASGILQYTINSITADGVSLPGAPFTRNGSVGQNWSNKRLTSYGNWGSFALSIPISSIPTNMMISMGDIKLYAGNSMNASALRDWIPGSLINSKMGDGTSFAINPPGNATTANASVTSDVPRTMNFNPGNTTLQRIDPRIKGETAWAIAPCTFPRIGNTIQHEGGGQNSQSPSEGHNTYTSPGRIDLAPSGTRSCDIPGDPHPFGGLPPNDNQADYFCPQNEKHWIFYNSKLQNRDASGNYTFDSPHDLGKVPTNVNWRRLRFMPRHLNETRNNISLIPDWAMLDVISFSSNNSTSSPIKIAPINPNGNFTYDTGINTAATGLPARRNNLPVLIKALEAPQASPNYRLGSLITRSISGGNLTFESFSMAAWDFCITGNFSNSLSNNITNRTWSTANGTSTGNTTWSQWRAARAWPNTALVLPGEVTEIGGVADYARSQYDFTNGGYQSIKRNEGRLSAFFPGLTLCSNFFTIYAYAQALDKTGNIDSEALTKTLVEVEIVTPATSSNGTTTPATYRVKKLYTQPIPMGQ